MPRRVARSEAAGAPGQDSFLDVICNLVGILIILVMVIGAQAKDVMIEALSQVTAADQQLENEAQEAAKTSSAIESKVEQIEQELNDNQLQVAYRKAERDKLYTLIRAAEHELDAERAKLDEAGRADFDLRTNLAAAKTELQSLKEGRHFVETQESAPSIIEHLPTPMAKTVFGKELHFRLAGGRLSFVPLDELVERLKGEAPQKIWKLKETDTITESIGPLSGYLMKYTLHTVRHQVQTRAGYAVQQAIELDRFVLFPIDESLGEPFDRALAAGSELNSLLARHDARKTTVTVWVYPDSYGLYRTLKQNLFQRGYLTAARPMPDGFPISGSPRGSRSTAE